MKILYITPDITDSGGISRVISLKANYLISYFDYEVSILSVNDSSPNCFYDFNPAIKWFTIKKSKNCFFFRNYIRFINKTISEENPEVIIICDAVLWLFIPWFLKTKTTVIFESHFSTAFQKDKFNCFYSKLRKKIILFWRNKTLKKFSYLVFVSKQASEEWELCNTKIIPNPLPFVIENKAALTNKKAMAVCINPYVKGLDRLLLVWSKIMEIHSDWVLDIYGNWAVNSEYLQLAQDLKLAKSVNFLPPTSDIKSSYNQCSIFLMTSRSEAFPMVLLEAMTSGVPCIAYDCPSGPRAIIEHKNNGFLIENGNSDSFVQKLELLIENENLRLQMGLNAHESVKKYEIEGVMKQWDNLFKDLKNNNSKIRLTFSKSKQSHFQ